MSAVLHVPRGAYETLCAHLLGQRGEAAAFIYTKPKSSDGDLRLDFIELELVSPKDCRGGSLYGIELTDTARSRVIAKAAQLAASITEAHSHPFTRRGAMFSGIDLEGLKEFVPHVWWRLRGGPYAALVFGQRDFDALVWVASPDNPLGLSALALDDGRTLKPTGRTTRYLQQSGDHEWMKRGTLGK